MRSQMRVYTGLATNDLENREQRSSLSHWATRTVRVIIQGGTVMIVLRLVPACLLFLLLAGQAIILPDQAAYAYCMCDQACPQPNCKCSPYCAVREPLQISTANSTTFQIRNLGENLALIVADSALNDTSIQPGNGGRTGLTLIAIPQEDLKLQCQRLKEILNWASEFLDGTSEFKQSYAMTKAVF
jgi:hypothetical protein